MYQISFSDQSMHELGKLNTLQQMQLVEQFSRITAERLSKSSKDIGIFEREGTTLYRLRAGEFRIYFERQGDTLHSHYIILKDTWTDFAVRCHLPVTDEQLVEQHTSFWKFLESLSK